MSNKSYHNNSASPINQSLSDPKSSRKNSVSGPSSSKGSTSDNDALQQKAFKDQEREEKISLALTRVSEGLSYRQAAKEIGISFGTVYGRFRGRKSRIRAQEVRMKLSFLEETIIEKVLLALICIGKPATQPFFVHTVNIILQAQGEIGVERVSRQWYRHFRRRHPSIDARDFSSLYKPLAKDPSNELSLAWFSQFERVCRNFRVLPENIYAMDEQGFSYTAGYSSSTNSSWQNSMSQTASESYGADISNVNTTSSRDTGSSISSHSSHNSDENTSNGKNSETPPAISMGAPPPDFFIMMNTVCGDGTALPPYLALESKFAEKVSAEYPKDWNINTSKSGWPNEKMLLKWIMHYFDPLTAPKAKGNQRILILDTHVGHFSLPFLQCGMDNNITFLFIPPHARGLHPLDVPPLRDFRQDIMSNTIDYQQAIDRLLMAQNTVFSNLNIKRSWRDAGLIPFDPSVVRPPKSNLKHHTQSPLTPITDDYESSSSQSTGYSPSRYAPIWPNERPIFKYIEVLDFNFDSFSAPSPERRISPSSNVPLFPEDPEEDDEEDNETPQSVPTDDIVNAFSSFDLNTYAPNPSKIFTTDSSDSDSNFHFHNSMSSDIFKAISKANSVMQKNKVLGAHSIEYHYFLSGFLERLSESLHQLSANLKNNSTVKPEDLEHLKLLETEVKVVESYNKELSAQIEPSIKANDNAISLLQRQIDDDATPIAEPSHKRGIRSVESKSSDEDVQHQRRKGSINNPMDVANINNAEDYDNESHQFIKPKFVFNSPFLSQEQQEKQTTQEQLENEDSSMPDSDHIEQTKINGTDNSLKLPYLSNNFFNNPNSSLLPPLQFGNQDQQTTLSGGPVRNTDPTSLAQYSQSPSTDKYRRGS